MIENVRLAANDCEAICWNIHEDVNDNVNENAWHKSLIHKAEMPAGADNLHLS